MKKTLFLFWFILVFPLLFVIPVSAPVDLEDDLNKLDSFFKINAVYEWEGSHQMLAFPDGRIWTKTGLNYPEYNWIDTVEVEVSFCFYIPSSMILIIDGQPRSFSNANMRTIITEASIRYHEYDSGSSTYPLIYTYSLPAIEGTYQSSESPITSIKETNILNDYYSTDPGGKTLQIVTHVTAHLQYYDNGEWHDYDSPSSVSAFSSSVDLFFSNSVEEFPFTSLTMIFLMITGIIVTEKRQKN